MGSIEYFNLNILNNDFSLSESEIKLEELLRNGNYCDFFKKINNNDYSKEFEKFNIYFELERAISFSAKNKKFMNKYMKTSLVMFIFGSKFTVCNENNVYEINDTKDNKQRSMRSHEFFDSCFNIKNYDLTKDFLNKLLVIAIENCCWIVVEKLSFLKNQKDAPILTDQLIIMIIIVLVQLVPLAVVVHVIVIIMKWVIELHLIWYLDIQMIVV